MKKLLFLAVLLLGFAACNNEENEDLTLNPDPETGIGELVMILSNYDVNSVQPLLCGAAGWIEEKHLEYDEAWNSIVGDFTASEGGATYRYKFYADGKLEDFTKPTFPPFDIELPKDRTWTFDPETRTLTIDGILSYHLIALGEDTFILDHIDTWSSAYPRYFRQVFKAKAIE